MRRRSSIALAATLLVASTLLAACGDEGTLEPVGRNRLAGGYARMQLYAIDAATTAGVFDTVWISPSGYGFWTTTYSTGAPQRNRGFVYELRGAELELREGESCPENANCIDLGDIEPMRGIIRGDSLTLWYTGIRAANLPAAEHFVRFSDYPGL